MNADPQDEFSFDRERAAGDLIGPEDALWPVNAYSDADELNDLLEAAQNGGLISARRRARLFVYPLSISEPDPVIAVEFSAVRPRLLGHELKLDAREDEDPIEFTLRFLAEVVDRGNAMLVKALADTVALDRIAAYVDRPGPWNGGDVCEVVARELEARDRDVLYNAAG
jgi:hypothetical protein